MGLVVLQLLLLLLLEERNKGLEKRIIRYLWWCYWVVVRLGGTVAVTAARGRGGGKGGGDGDMVLAVVMRGHDVVSEGGRKYTEIWRVLTDKRGLGMGGFLFLILRFIFYFFL